MLATILEWISAIILFASNPEEEAELAARLFVSFARVGLGSVLLIGLIVVVLIGRAADNSAENGPDVSDESDRKSPATNIAAIIAMVVGTLAAIFIVFMATRLAAAAKEIVPQRRPEDWIIDLTMIGLSAAGLLFTVTPVVLGVLVLFRQVWARYVLIAYGALAGIGLLLWQPTRSDPIIVVVVLAIPVLLIWGELRSNGRTGPFRNRWRGIVLLVVNLWFICGILAVSLLPAEGEAATGVTIVLLGANIYYIVALLFAMWALHKDRDQMWASLNSAVVVVAPLMVSICSLVATIIGLLLP